MKTIILKTSTGEVDVGFDDQAEIVWTPELREAYEYEVAFAAMGGTRSQLDKFVEKWEDPSQRQSRIETMLYGLPTARAAVALAVECVEYAFTATDRATNTSKAAVIVGHCIKAAREFVEHPDVLGKMAAVEWSFDTIDGFEKSNTVDGVVDRELLNACRIILGAEMRLYRAGTLNSGIVGSPNSVIHEISSAVYAVAWYRYTERQKVGPRHVKPAQLFTRMQREEELRALLRLIEMVHDAQLEQTPPSTLGGTL